MALLILCVVVFISPAMMARLKKSIGGRTAGNPTGGLSLYHRCMSILLAYMILITPCGRQQLAHGATNYHDLRTDTWANGDQTVYYDYDVNGSMTEKLTALTSEQYPDTNYLEKIVYKYNLCNRLCRIETYDDTQTLTDVVEYKYNPDGIRVQKTVDPDGSPVVTDYIVDPYNHTGYAQTLVETDGTNTTSYVIGDDVLAQATDTATPKYLLYDGHGSTRQLTNDSGAVITDQNYSYDGYGVMLGGNPQAAMQTHLLYAGEHFDTHSQHYYNRARWYNPLSGLFNRMDPYSGNTQDPQSLHKYLYCHAGPINNIDPMGLFSLSQINVTIAIQSVMFTLNFVSAVHHAKRLAISVTEVINQWSRGYFWKGLAYVAMAALHGIGLVLNMVGMMASMTPPPGLSGATLALAGGGAMTVNGIWSVIISNPALADWVLSTVAPLAFSAFIVFMASRAGGGGGSSGGASSEDHHKVPHSNKTYEHENHPLMKQAGWGKKDLQKMPENRMKLYNHRGRHWNVYHQNIKKMMDDALPSIENKGQGAAREALRKIFNEIEIGIKSGELKPYGSKEVWTN